MPPRPDRAEDRAIAPQVGGSAAFRAFLRDEPMPRIEARYRTTDEDAIVGESLAGLFVIGMLAQKPALFDRYIAIDPSLWWSRNALAENAPQWIAQAAPYPVSVHASTGREAGESPSMQRFVQTLRTRAPVSWHAVHATLAEETHATVFHPAALQALHTVRPGTLSRVPAGPARRPHDPVTVRPSAARLCAAVFRRGPPFVSGALHAERA